MRLLTCLWAAVALATGCGGGSDAEPIEPQPGTWDKHDEAATADTCHLGVTEGDGSFELTNHGDGTFTVDPRDGYDPFLCTLDGRDFTCPSRLREEFPLARIDPSLAGTASVHVSVTGRFSSPTEASGEQTAEVSCQGTGCTTLAAHLSTSFPCSYSQAYTTSAR